MVIPSEVILLYRTVLAILGFLLLFFHMKLSIVLSRSIKILCLNCVEFNGIVLNLLIAFGKMAISTMLILLIHDHGISSRLLISPPISFFKDLKSLSYRSFTCFVRVIPRYFILFVAIVKGVVSMISFSALSSFICNRFTDIL